MVDHQINRSCSNLFVLFCAQEQVRYVLTILVDNMKQFLSD